MCNHRAALYAVITLRDLVAAMDPRVPAWACIHRQSSYVNQLAPARWFIACDVAYQAPRCSAAAAVEWWAPARASLVVQLPRASKDHFSLDIPSALSLSVFRQLLKTSRSIVSLISLSCGNIACVPIRRSYPDLLIWHFIFVVLEIIIQVTLNASLLWW